jgi:DNA repair exonuclease SbcCD nuclease subunit
MKSEPIAILCSDIHLSLRQPACRADDWLSVQKDYLGQVKSLACTVKERWLGNKNTTGRPVPVLCAGDIFDRWNPPPELIRFALEHLPDGMICVPGQHDLPEHRFDQIHRSAYGCLREAGKIRCAATHRRSEVPSRSHIWLEENWAVYGFAWGEPVEPPLQDKSIALVHQYVWTIGASYPGAPEDSHLANFMKLLRRYKAAAFGDNHKGFLKRLKTGTTVLNCGGFIRRKSDELDYRPSVGILHADGSIKLHHLDTRKDEFRTPEEMAEVAEADMAGFVDELSRLGEHDMDFRQSVRIAAETMDLSGPVKEKVLKCLAEDKTAA